MDFTATSDTMSDTFYVETDNFTCQMSINVVLAHVDEGGNYYELSIPYRAGFGDAILSILMFLVIASFVWGGLGFSLREMFSEDDRVLGMPIEDEPQPAPKNLGKSN